MAKIIILYGSVRRERQGIKAARFMENKVSEMGHDAMLIDPLKYNLPFLDKMFKEYDDESAPKNMKKLSKLFDEAEGFIIVSGEYNHSIPPALKNILDHFQSEYQFKPSGIVSYSAGMFGGVRVAMHLRALLPELGMVTIPSIFPISKVQDSFDDNGNAIDKTYENRVVRFLEEFNWYVDALSKKRSEGTPY